MVIKFLKRSFFQRLLGISATSKPGIDGCWNYADGKLTIVQCCSINKSTYDSGGNKIFGPAPHPIIPYPVKRKQDNLIVSVN